MHAAVDPASPAPRTTPGAGGPADPGPLVIDRPRHVVIPAIDVVAPLVPLGLTPQGALTAPTGFAEAGWHQGGPEPGEPGPTVIAGHVDSYEGPAIFYELSKLLPGQSVQILGDAGETLTYRVDHIEQYPKDAFPAATVYRKTPGSSLRLITCGGGFNEAAKSYDDNVVVYASQVQS